MRSGMRRIPGAALIFPAISLMLLAPLALAAGSGGGGSSSGSTQCSADIYTCGEWGLCSPEGTRTRSCEFDYDCPFVTDPAPRESERCEYVSALLNSLKCQNLATVRERVSCRLGLSEEELSRELEISYLPEECRALPGAAERESCVKRYGSLRPCWSKPYTQRPDCVRGVLGMKDVRSEVEACNQKSLGSRAGCMSALRTKVYQLTTARFYDLEERAEEMMEQGADRELVTDFVTDLELKKQDFSKAATIDQKKQIVLEVRILWKEFVEQVREKG